MGSTVAAQSELVLRVGTTETSTPPNREKGREGEGESVVNSGWQTIRQWKGLKTRFYSSLCLSEHSYHCSISNKRLWVSRTYQSSFKCKNQYLETFIYFNYLRGTNLNSQLLAIYWLWWGRGSFYKQFKQIGQTHWRGANIDCLCTEMVSWGQQANDWNVNIC